jgi:hypothetical protein
MPFMTITVSSPSSSFDGEGRLVTAMLRPGKRPSGQEIRAFVRRLVGAIRALWPKAASPRRSIAWTSSAPLSSRYLLTWTQSGQRSSVSPRI